VGPFNDVDLSMGGGASYRHIVGEFSVFSHNQRSLILLCRSG
jgi:hypothetical protein